MRLQEYMENKYSVGTFQMLQTVYSTYNMTCQGYNPTIIAPGSSLCTTVGIIKLQRASKTVHSRLLYSAS